MRAIVGALCALALAAPLASAQGRTEVRSYLEAGMAPHVARGYAQDRTEPDLLVVSRERGDPHLWSIYLVAGVNYRVYGACDDHCSDMDMEIYGNDGALVDRDLSTNDTPFVQITPTVSGRAYVRVWAFACDPGPCALAARLMSGGQPEDRVETGRTVETAPG
ncbi:hypothetical protein U91I_00055 [alpha proteobacterium U9-1i]|nr:hypothetical protein U91I_00055 [alpha proteobacterium U9-1i]